MFHRQALCSLISWIFDSFSDEFPGSSTPSWGGGADEGLGKTIANPLFQTDGPSADTDKDLAEASKTAFRGEGYAYPGTNILSGSFIVSGWMAIIANYKPTEYTAPAVLMQPPWADPPIAMFVNIDVTIFRALLFTA